MSTQVKPDERQILAFHEQQRENPRPSEENVPMELSTTEIYATLPTPMLISNGYTSIHQAAARGDIQTLRSYFSRVSLNFHSKIRSFLVEIRDPQTGRTPLHWGVMSGNVDVVKFLIENSASVNARDFNGLSPLHLAVHNYLFHQFNLEFLKITCILAWAGAQVDGGDCNGVTPLHIAAESGCADLVRFFLMKNFTTQVDVSDDVGETPLFYALRGGHKEVVQTLIDYGCDCTHRNFDGESPVDFCGDIGEENLKIFIISQGNFSTNNNICSSEKMLAMSD